MSYILEALKKIEQKQQREGAPRLLTIPSDFPEEQKKRSVLPFVIAGALVLNAAVMTAWWMAPRTAKQHLIGVETASDIKGGMSAPLESLPALPAPLIGEKNSTIRQGSKAAEQPARISSRSPEREAAETASVQTGRAEPSVGAPAEALPRKETRGASAAPKGKLLSLEDLPPAVRRDLPEFKISGHAYSSEPRFRVARVNSKIVQEGEALSQGLKVDEIVPGGVVFTYQGYRFRVGINDEK